MLTIAERSPGHSRHRARAIRQSRALGVGDRLDQTQQEPLRASDKGDWEGMREELIRAQADVEKSMLDLHDEQMSHMISLGGWLRGFQLAANSCLQNYSPDRALVLGRVEIMDYYIDRLDTLHPRLKKTEFVATITSQIKSLRDLAAEAQGRPPTEAEVKKMRTWRTLLNRSRLVRLTATGRSFFLDAVSYSFPTSVSRRGGRRQCANVPRGGRRFLEETHERFPESASRLGLDEFNARLGRNDEGSYRAQVRLLERTLNTIEKMPEASLAATTGSIGALFSRWFARSCSMPETFSWRNNLQIHCRGRSHFRSCHSPC